MDPELTNYKGGIDIVLGAEDGSDNGTAYVPETFFFDPLVNDTRVCFIREDTEIALALNERSMASTGGSRNKTMIGTEGGGAIRYKLNGLAEILRWAPQTDGGGTCYPAYSAPFTLESAVGDGLIDSVGDEWITMMVARDSSPYAGFSLTPGNGDSWASDGKYTLFCVNPTTPALKIEASGAGQFYTTPAWTYLVPKIHDQTTYFQGTCTFELRNIYGANISYKINGGSTVNVGAASVVLNQGHFTDGPNDLEYWYTATPAAVRTRTVVKNPAFPSAGEDHGTRLLNGDEGWAAFQSRAVRLPYTDALGGVRYNVGHHYGDWNSQKLTGMRFGGQNFPLNSNGQMADNAVLAKFHGFDAFYPGGGGEPAAPDSTPYAVFAKEQLMEAAISQHPVGIEGPWNDSLPCADTVYRGYVDATLAINPAIAYDILIDGFRSDQETGGITPIEDYYLRDVLASWVHVCVLGRTADRANAGGFWGTSRVIAGTVITCVLSEYSTPYYGSSGLDGVATTYAYAPHAADNYPWVDYFLHDSTPFGLLGLEGVTGTENCIFPPEESPTVWNGKSDYIEQISPNVCWYANLVEQYADIDDGHETLLNFLDLLTSGTVQGTEDPIGPVRNWMLPLLRPGFPLPAENATSDFLLVAAPLSPAYIMKDMGAYTVAYFDDNYFGGAISAKPVADKPPRIYENPAQLPIVVTLTCPTAGASIYYTLDGSEPDNTDLVYSEPLEFGTTTTLKAVAQTEGGGYSPVLSGLYQVGTLGRSAPPAGQTCTPV